MSIKTIDSNFVNTAAGVDKKIDAGAQRMIYDVLQSTQYSTPLASTVRELATNAWDSQREKEMVLEILSGQKSASDYYISRDGEQYKDSNFDPSYYDPSYLDTENNRVLIRHTYEKGTGFCDRFEVIDHGVGLGDGRLEGILSLGYSTKRNTTEGFGAFGLGAKVAFSTGVPMYQMESIHNGRKFKCDCYPYKTIFTVPALNLSTGKQNNFITFSDGTKVYYEETDEKNGVTISFLTKRHNRTGFTEAVLDQLVYVKGIDFEIVDNEEQWQSMKKEVKADVMYNSDSLILSSRTVFNRPHIVIVKNEGDEAGINYGLIDFKELELQDMYGSIGFKCPVRQSYRDEDGKEIVISEGVSVTPNREKVIWNDNTKKYVLSVIERATKEASELINEELADSTDLFKWINACQRIFQSRGDDSVLGRLSRIVDKDTLTPHFPLNPDIKFGPIKKMFGAIELERIYVDYRNNVQKESIEFGTQLQNIDHVFIKDSNYNREKNIYMCKTLGYGSFYTVQHKGISEEERAKLFKDKGAHAITSYESFTDSVWKLIETSPSVQNYSDVDVPEDILKKLEQHGTANVALTPAEKRALEEKEVAFTIRMDTYSRGTTRPVFVLDKLEAKGEDLFFSGDTVHYFESQDSKFAIDVARALQGVVSKKSQFTDRHYYYGSDNAGVFWSICSTNSFKHKENVSEHAKQNCPNLLQLNRSLISKLKPNMDVKHVKDMLYVRELRDGKAVLTVDPLVRKAYTAYRIGQAWDQFDYLSNFSNINKNICDKYNRLYTFMFAYLDSYRFFDPSNEVFKTCDRFYDFHMKVKQFGLEGEDLKNESFKNFIFTDITDTDVVEQEYLDILEELKDYNEDIGAFMHTVDKYAYRDPEATREVIRYLETRDRINWSWGKE